MLYYIRKLGKRGLEVKKNKIREMTYRTVFQTGEIPQRARKLSPYVTSVSNTDSLLSLKRFLYGSAFQLFVSLTNMRTKMKCQ